jgi:hypothetical protein
MKKLKLINVGKGKLVMYSKNNQFTLNFEYKEDKDNLILVSNFSEVMMHYIDNICITDQMSEWVQFCFKMNDTTYKYFEYDYTENSLKEDIIDFDQLTLDEKKDAISGYYSSLDEVYEIYGEDSEQIIVECFFEQS